MFMPAMFKTLLIFRSCHSSCDKMKAAKCDEVTWSDQGMDKYEGDIKIFGHAELIQNLLTLLEITLDKNVTHWLGRRIMLSPVADRERVNLAGYDLPRKFIYPERP